MRYTYIYIYIPRVITLQLIIFGAFLFFGKGKDRRGGFIITEDMNTSCGAFLLENIGFNNVCSHAESGSGYIT